MPDLSPPYPEIYKALMEGKVIPFLGAGAPLYDRNPGNTPWLQTRKGEAKVCHLPTAGELAEYLAQTTSLPLEEKAELTKMAQYFEAVRGTAILRERLREIFSYGQAPTPLHEFLAHVRSPLLIVTTNYDDMMERALQKRRKRYDVVVHLTDQDMVLWCRHGDREPKEEHPENVLIDLDKVSVVYKIHGAIDRRANENGQYVITENDYVEFFARMMRQAVVPNMIVKEFQKRPFLFLGYGLYDWNLRVIFNAIQKFHGDSRVRSWAIETLSKPVERKLWESRNVTVYDGLTLKQFLKELKQKGPLKP
jgi:hypothetical protein